MVRAARGYVPSVEITEVMAERGHEQVMLVAEAPTGLRAVIAIHSTALATRNVVVVALASA